MAEEGNAAGPSGIVKIKDNFVKITKDRKRFVFLAAKSLELICCFIAAIAESYKTLFVSEYQFGPPKLPGYKNLNNSRSDFYFRVVANALDGFVIINVILLVSYLLGEQLPKKMLCLFSFVGSLYCLAAGGILLNDHGDSNNILNQYDDATEMTISGIFAIIAGLVFLAEAIINYRCWS